MSENPEQRESIMAIPESAFTIGTLIPLLSIFMGGLIVLVPVVGFTARHAMKPIVEALGTLQALPLVIAQVEAATQQAEELSRAVERLEQQLHHARIPARQLEAVEE
jgi:hypothetical protein